MSESESEREREIEYERARTRQSSSTVRKCERGPRTPMRGDADIRRLSGFLTRATQIIPYAYVIRYAGKMLPRKYRAVFLRRHGPPESRYDEGKSERKRVRERKGVRERERENARERERGKKNYGVSSNK